MSDSVSIVIVNWNAEALLERCLRSVAAQSVAPYEVIVVDNGSSDGSANLVEKKFKFVRLIRAKTNLGFAAANNLALKNISPDSNWIVLLNPDAFPEPTWLERLVDAARHNPEYAFFGSRLVNASDPDLLDGAGDAYHPSGLVWRIGHGKKIEPTGLEPKEIFSVCAASAMYRKDVLLQAGGFDEDFFCYVEDVDLGFRLRLLGHRCLYVPESVACHLGSGLTGRRSDFSVYHGHRNLVWTYVKDMPGILFWIFLPLHLALNVATVIYFGFHGQGRVIVRAKWDSIKELPKMWRKRRAIQSDRVVGSGSIWRLMDKKMIPGGNGLIRQLDDERGRSNA